MMTFTYAIALGLFSCILQHTTAQLQPEACSELEFKCGNGRCIFFFFICDGDNDCGDDSDEQGCVNPGRCSGGLEFLCDNGKCIYDGFSCDGEDDCGDMSDEQNCLPQKCGRQLPDNSRTFQSPNFPLSYPNSAKCTWIIQGVEGAIIKLRFTTFRLQASEYHDERDEDVCYDWVEILETKTSNFSGRCGTNAQPYTSEGNYLWVQFRSGRFVVEQGFRAEYEIISNPTCRDITCLNTGWCRRDVRCVCPSMYTGRYCQIDPCQHIKCLNGGKCNIIGTYTTHCSCKSGFTGLRCEIERDLDSCQDITCLNGGRCVDGSCMCAHGYRGQYCQQREVSDPCQDITCRNGGRCVTGRCLCRAGYTDQYCETALNPCENVVCENGGSCAAEGSSFTCQCQAYYAGRYCQTALNPCENVVCENGGSCAAEGSSFTCRCQANYAGRYCQTAINPCEYIICSNGGTCIAEGSRFNCKCRIEYTGLYCQTDKDPCLGISCSNGEICVSDGNVTQCQYHAEYSEEYADTEGVIRSSKKTRAVVPTIVCLIVAVLVTVGAICKCMKMKSHPSNETEPRVHFTRGRVSPDKQGYDDCYNSPLTQTPEPRVHFTPERISPDKQVYDDCYDSPQIPDNRTQNMHARSVRIHLIPIRTTGKMTTGSQEELSLMPHKSPSN